MAQFWLGNIVGSELAFFNVEHSLSSWEAVGIFLAIKASNLFGKIDFSPKYIPNIDPFCGKVYKIDQGLLK